MTTQQKHNIHHEVRMKKVTVTFHNGENVTEFKFQAITCRQEGDVVNFIDNSNESVFGVHVDRYITHRFQGEGEKCTCGINEVCSDCPK